MEDYEDIIYNACIDEDIDEIETILSEHGFSTHFSDEKIDEGLDDNEDGNEYLMMRSYDVRKKDDDSVRYYVRFYYGDYTQTITYININ